MIILFALIQLIVAIILAFLLSGYIAQGKARLQGRKGQGLSQPFANIIKLWFKETISPEGSGFGFRVAPLMVIVLSLIIVLSLSIISVNPPLNVDLIWIIVVFALIRLLTMWGAYDSGSPFGFIGANRELGVSVLVEPAMIVLVISIGLTHGTTQLHAIVSSTQSMQILQFWSPHIILALIALSIIVISETGRFPVNNPDTHLELGMMHEATTLEYTGQNLAMIEVSQALKMLIFFTLIIDMFFPYYIPAELSVTTFFIGMGAYIIKLYIMATGLIVFEFFLSKMRLMQMNRFTGIAMVLALLSLVIFFVQE